ncbi:MAG TPA: hypothetical protein VFY14_05535, partial [Streptomyces sp.]|nr:hypothetical protein [Streptomyces sp.]
DGTGYAAVVCAVLTALWAGYGAALPRPGLRGPLPVAVCCAQLPLLLWAVAGDAGPYAFAWALLATAAGDAVLALWTAGRGARPVAVTAVVTGCALGGPGMLLAASLALAAPDGPASAHAAALLGTAAAVLLYAAGRRPEAAVALASVAGLAVLVAGGGALRGVLPGPHWPVLGFALCAAALAAVPVSTASAGASVGAGLRLASAVVLTGTGLWALPAVALAVLGPMGWAVRAWDGAPPGARAAVVPVVAPDTVVPGGMAVPAVLGVLAVVLGAVARGPLLRAPGVWRARAAAGALVLGSAVAVTLPVALDLRYQVAVALLVALVVLLLAVSVSAAGHTASELPEPLPELSARAARAALGTALVLGLTAGCWSLAERTVTVTVLAVLAVAFTAAAVAMRSTALLGPVAAVASVLWTAALAGAVPAVFGAPAHQAAFAVLGVAVATAPLAARLRKRPAGLPVECAGYGVAAVSLALTLAEPAALSLALALCGVAATGVALRADRRRSAAFLGTVLLVLAWWVRLGLWGVGVPEAYTVPVAVPALVLGHLRRRQRPDLSSWAAYGGGLVAAFAPGVMALAWDAHWPRPLLLGTSALVVTGLGARLRLRAPLLLGGGVLVLVAGHELAPYVVQAVGVLPRWALPAAAGALLLAVGATYEQRLRGVRRLRESMGRMR